MSKQKKTRRKLDDAIVFNSDVYLESTNLLEANQQQLKPDGESGTLLSNQILKRIHI